MMDQTKAKGSAIANSRPTTVDDLLVFNRLLRLQIDIKWTRIHCLNGPRARVKRILSVDPQRGEIAVSLGVLVLKARWFSRNQVQSIPCNKTECQQSLTSRTANHHLSAIGYAPTDTPRPGQQADNQYLTLRCRQHIDGGENASRFGRIGAKLTDLQRSRYRYPKLVRFNPLLPRPVTTKDPHDNALVLDMSGHVRHSVSPFDKSSDVIRFPRCITTGVPDRIAGPTCGTHDEPCDPDECDSEENQARFGRFRCSRGKQV
jgi:hypothetical protein